MTYIDGSAEMDGDDVGLNTGALVGSSTSGKGTGAGVGIFVVGANVHLGFTQTEGSNVGLGGLVPCTQSAHLVALTNSPVSAPFSSIAGINSHGSRS
mmetsp:Transcript_17331/g.22140  ORF Transcript_17331/g.22140 Transcript_17331/m.22140 type:complete len:97 (-) Transcript_17331:46-336(-)